VNVIGEVDAVIHNAAIYVDRRRVSTPEGHARTLAVNVLAPYMLTAWINRPSRLVYISSGMHKQGDSSLRDIDWMART
jgi:NAD(P)-dependent dehydrogenase (short-subunit alcohol dehydrogenase family)